MGNLETKGGLCPTGSLPGASASSSNGVSTFLCFTFLSSIFASSILSSFTHFSHCPPVLFPLAPGTCIHPLSLLSPFCSLSPLPSLWCPGLLETDSFAHSGSGSLSSSGWAPSPPGQAQLYSGGWRLLVLVAQASAQPSTGVRCHPWRLFNSVSVKLWCLGSLAHPFLLVSLFRVSPGTVEVHLPWVASSLAEGPVSMWLSSSAVNLCCRWAIRSTWERELRDKPRCAPG